MVCWGSVKFFLSPIKLCIGGLWQIAVSWTIHILASNCTLCSCTWSIPELLVISVRGGDAVIIWSHFWCYCCNCSVTGSVFSNDQHIWNVISEFIFVLFWHFLQQYCHYQSILNVFRLHPNEFIKSLDDLVIFIAQVRKVPLCTYLEYLVHGRVQPPNSSGDKMDSVCTIKLGV